MEHVLPLPPPTAKLASTGLQPATGPTRQVWHSPWGMFRPIFWDHEVDGIMPSTDEIITIC